MLCMYSKSGIEEEYNFPDKSYSPFVGSAVKGTAIHKSY